MCKIDETIGLPPYYDFDTARGKVNFISQVIIFSLIMRPFFTTPTSSNIVKVCYTPQRFNHEKTDVEVKRIRESYPKDKKEKKKERNHFLLQKKYS